MSDLFFFNDTATTEIYTLSLHDALPIWSGDGRRRRLLDHGAGEGQDDGVVLLGRSGREGSGGRGRAGGPAVQDRGGGRTGGGGGGGGGDGAGAPRSGEQTSALQSRQYLVCRPPLEKKTRLRPP